MAVGVPETEVFAAADRVLARGERPTTERVRAELGRGSPARVGQLLEQWWDGLAKRLAGETRLPELPPAVAEAFKSVWASASEHGTQLAQAAVAETAAELAQEHTRLAEERAEGQRAVDAAHAAQAAAEARLGDLQRLLVQQTAQQADLAAQRDALAARNAQLEQALATAQTALAEQRHTTAQERETLQQHIRATEQRAHAEVDRARQDTKELQAQLALVQREHATTEQQYRQQLDAVRTALTRAERDATVQRARAEALEQQLARLSDLTATLQVTLAQAQEGAFPRRSRQRTAKPVTTKPRARAKPKST